jgi:hypothetical protein
MAIAINMPGGVYTTNYQHLQEEGVGASHYVVLTSQFCWIEEIEQDFGDDWPSPCTLYFGSLAACKRVYRDFHNLFEFK